MSTEGNELDPLSSIVNKVAATGLGDIGAEPDVAPEAVPEAPASPRKGTKRHKIRTDYVSPLVPLEPFVMSEPRPQFKRPIKLDCNNHTHALLVADMNGPDRCPICFRTILRRPRTTCAKHSVHFCGECFTDEQLQQFLRQRNKDEEQKRS